MPFPLNWSEELVSEYLELNGYFVRTNIPVPNEGKAGRRELDIIAIKQEQDQNKIIHVETGLPRSFKDIEKKFLPITTNRIEQIAKKLGYERYNLALWYVQSWGGQKGTSKRYHESKIQLEKKGIRLITFQEILCLIIDSIIKWANENQRTQKSSLPANMWLLKLIEALHLSGNLNMI